jgi:hypothetical protein
MVCVISKNFAISAKSAKQKVTLVRVRIEEMWSNCYINLEFAKNKVNK